MGPKGLWTIIDSVKNDTQTMMEFSMEEGFNRRPHWGVYRLGVDASIWMEQCAHASAPHRNWHSCSPALYIFFKKLSNVLATCVQPVFVFDGPQRPRVKRGKSVVFNNNAMVDPVKEFAKACGFGYHTAPGEAEAELAHMNALGIIDGVLTDDSDALVFGAQTVIRNITYTDNNAHIGVYKAVAIKNSKDLGLDRAGLILIALLCGGDYHQAGLPGCGTVIAKGLARYGLGGPLYDAALNGDDDDVDALLPAWREEVRRVLREDPLGYIGARHPALALRVSDAFPSRDALQCYVHPVTSTFDGLYHLPLPRFPDICALVRACERGHLFNGMADILVKFRKYLWPGLILRELLEHVFARVHHQNPLPPSGLLYFEVRPHGNVKEDIALKVMNGALAAVVQKSLEDIHGREMGEYMNLARKWRTVSVPSTVFLQAQEDLALARELSGNPEYYDTVPTEGDKPEFVEGASRDTVDLTGKNVGDIIDLTGA